MKQIHKRVFSWTHPLKSHIEILLPSKKRKNTHGEKHNLDGSEAARVSTNDHHLVNIRNPGVASSLPEVSQKKKRLDLADCFGTFGSEFSSPGVALENWEKWWKKRYTPFLHSPKNNLGCIVCSLRCLDSMFYVFGVQSYRTSVSVILDVPEATIHTPPKHTVPPRNKGWIRPTIMGNTHSPISP